MFPAPVPVKGKRGHLPGGWLRCCCLLAWSVSELASPSGSARRFFDLMRPRPISLSRWNPSPCRLRNSAPIGAPRLPLERSSRFAPYSCGTNWRVPFAWFRSIPVGEALERPSHPPPPGTNRKRSLPMIKLQAGEYLGS